MNKKIGFIGAGNMGGAMIGGILKAQLIPSENIHVFDLNTTKLESMKQEFSIQIASSAQELTKSCDWIIVAVKPNIFPPVLKDIKEILDASKTLISIAAGVTIEQIENIVGKEQKIVRTMPNTPALVGEGMSAICPNSQIDSQEVDDIVKIFESFGKAHIVKEYLIDAVIGVSGSAPAYVFMFIEAMADAAVLGGLPRDAAYDFAAQTVMGAAKMVIETGKHPGELKDMVCSPGGTTIEAVRSLEKHGFRSAVIEGMLDCMAKSKKMSE